MKEKELKCVWNTGGNCNGDTKKIEMFQSQIMVPVCEYHLQDHKYIMALHAAGNPMEDILEMTRAEREEMFDNLDDKLKDSEI